MSHAAAKATEAAAPEATEAATAAPRRIAGMPTYGYAATREGAMAAFAKSWTGMSGTPTRTRLGIGSGASERGFENP